MSRRATRSQLLPVVTLIMLLAGSFAIFVVARHVVKDQEQRLLRERAAEVGALLSNATSNIESTLEVLGPVATSATTADSTAFASGAGQLIKGDTKTIGVAVEGGAGFVVAAMVGDGLPVGEPLVDLRAALAARALSLTPPQLVADLVPDGTGVRLVLARGVGDGRAVVYEESAVRGQPAPSTANSPFRQLRVALYASAEVQPQRLVVTTETDVPLTGDVVLMPFAVGADRWVLAVSARQPLVGTFTRDVPWLFLGGGLLMAVLAASIVETLVRRREYGMVLVDERTSELRGTLAELRTTRAFLERLLHSGPVVVSRRRVTDRAVSYLSPNAERILGFSFDDVADPDFLARLIHPDDVALYTAAVDRVADGQSEQEHLEYRLWSSGDSYRWISVTLVPEPDEDQNPVVAVLAYAIDIDDRRRAENARQEAYEEAEAANQSKTQFLSRMSHELRTPLNAVLGFGQLLEIEELTGDQHDAVDHILKGGRHLLNLIIEVLDISRIESGEMSLSPEPVLASLLVQEAVDLIRPLAAQRDLQLVVDSSELCNCFVFADRQRTKQILLNLLSNAIKYNRPRGTIALSCARPDSTKVHISVADTGLGIPAERLGLLFTPFERLGAENTAEEGTGIGLALSQRLADAMGGNLTAASTPGQGTTFTLELPRVEGPVQRFERLSVDDAPATEAQHARRVVLHIEDNLANLTLVERILAQRPDVEVVAAMYGRLALELAREHDPAMILLDLHLPDMGGEQVLQRLRDDPVTASIPVIIITADASPGHLQRLLSAGAVAYLTKPVDVRQLLAHVDEILGAEAELHAAAAGPSVS